MRGSRQRESKGKVRAEGKKESEFKKGEKSCDVEGDEKRRAMRVLTLTQLKEINVSL